VVCSKTSGQTDVIEHGVTGLYVDPGDVMALRNAIRLLLDDPSEAGRLGDAGREWVVANADVALYADRLATAVLADLATAP
jgi:phosphatidylinositol alpha-1,6-mannosyltransferase